MPEGVHQLLGLGQRDPTDNIRHDSAVPDLGEEPEIIKFKSQDEQGDDEGNDDDHILDLHVLGYPEHP